VIEQNGRTGCQLLVAGRRYELLFNTTGENGGTFNGKPLVTTDANSAKPN
jgi:hypothetical protein